MNTSKTEALKHQEPLTRPRVTLTTEIGTKTETWPGWIDRAESRYDSASQQLFLIAQVDEPYGRQPALRAGLFVRADITGKTLDNVYILPRRAVRRGNEVALSIKWHPPRAFPRKQEQNTKKPSQKGPPPKVKGKKKNKIPDILVRREIVVLWRDEKVMVTRSLQPDEVLITDPIDYATNGQELLVHVKGESAPTPTGPLKDKGKGKGRFRKGKGKGKPKG